MSSLLLYISVGFFRHQGQIWCESQAKNGLRLWARHFDRLTVVARCDAAAPPEGYEPLLGDEEWAPRVAFEWVPSAWTLRRFLPALPNVTRRYRRLINEHDRAVFGLGGVIGAWGAVGAVLAGCMGRPYAVWTDRVVSEVMREDAKAVSGLSRIKREVDWRLSRRLDAHLVRHSALGLFHGASTFEAFSPICPNPHIVHDSHVSAAQVLTDAELAEKQDSLKGAETIRIVYAGRAALMKGPLDWVKAIAGLREAGIDLSALWVGDGPLLEQAKARASELGVADIIEFPGFISDRETVLRVLSEAHILMFCHKTPESPRILIESMSRGTPIVGYGDAFSADLLQSVEAGVLTEKNDLKRLVDAVASRSVDRPRLANMMTAARDRGRDFTDEAVFRHRSEVILEELPIA